MITGLHAVLFSREAEKIRAYLRDVLQLPSVDAGGGWLIFALPPAEMGVHPSEGSSTELYLLCDDLVATVEDLRARGVEFDGIATDRDWGRVINLRLPDGALLGLYEPRHATALGLGG